LYGTDDAHIGMNQCGAAWTSAKVTAEHGGSRVGPLSGTYFVFACELCSAMASASVASAAYMASATGVAASITHLVSVEVIERLISTRRMWTSVAVMWIETIINVAAEIVGAVEPRAGPDEHAAVEPLRPVVPIWGAPVWGVVVKTIRASRLWSDIDGDLGRCRPRDG
jgi:hypothetical protein